MKMCLNIFIKKSTLKMEEFLRGQLESSSENVALLLQVSAYIIKVFRVFHRQNCNLNWDSLRVCYNAC